MSFVVEPVMVENPQQSDTDDTKGSEDCSLVESWTQSQLYFKGTGGLFTASAQTILENAPCGLAVQGESCYLNASAGYTPDFGVYLLAKRSGGSSVLVGGHSGHVDLRYGFHCLPVHGDDNTPYGKLLLSRYDRSSVLYKYPKSLFIEIVDRGRLIVKVTSDEGKLVAKGWMSSETWNLDVGAGYNGPLLVSCVLATILCPWHEVNWAFDWKGLSDTRYAALAVQDFLSQLRQLRAKEEHPENGVLRIQ